MASNETTESDEETGQKDEAARRLTGDRVEWYRWSMRGVAASIGSVTSALGIDLDRLSARPLADQLAAALRAKILDGSIPPDRKLPTEAELVADLEVSRSTVTRALAMLRDEGVVVFAPGKGVYTAAAQDIAKAKKAQRRG